MDFATDFNEIKLPQNILDFIRRFDGVNVSINYNSASANHGYAHCLFISVSISMLTRTCHRCGYDSLHNPDDTESKCGRHTYNSWRYDVVFSWTQNENNKTLEECFNEWFAVNHDRFKQEKCVPIKIMDFGYRGWR